MSDRPESRRWRAVGSDEWTPEERRGADAGGSVLESRLEAVLELGRTALDARTGAVVRTGADSQTVFAAVGRTDGRPVGPEDAVRRTERTGRVTSDTVDGSGDDWYVGASVGVDGEPFGVVCFTGPGPVAVDDAHRAVAGLVAELVGVELARNRQTGAVWSEHALTETLLDTIPDLLYAFSTDGTIVQWNDELEAVTGYDTAAVAGMGPLDFFGEEDRARIAASIETIGEDETVPDPVEANLVTSDGERIPYQFNGAPITDGEEVLGFAGVGRDISEYREHEETLTELHDVTRELLPAEDETAICERVVSAATDLLDISVVGMFLFDETANVLRPVFQNDGADAVVSTVPTFGPGEGIAWDAFMNGEIEVYDDVRASNDVYNPETSVRSELFVPVGEHGILLAGSTTVGAFDDRTVELADILAANAEAALDNVARKQELAARDAEVARQHSRLQRLNEVNERVRRIGHELVGADTTGEITGLVCDRLVEADQFSYVCVCQRTPDERMVVASEAGGGDGYPEAVRAAAERTGDGTAEHDGTANEPVWSAARGREPVAVERVADDFQADPWRRLALSRDFRSVVAVPLDHDGAPGGVLGVYADSAGAFDEETVRVLTELGDMVAEALATARRRQARSADDAVELVLRVEPPPRPTGEFAAAVGDEVTVTRTLPQSGDTCLLYGSTRADAETVERALATAAGVADGRVITDTVDGTRFELSTEHRTVAQLVRGFGGTCRRVTVADSVARVVVRLPLDADVRQFVEAVGDESTSVEVVAQRATADDGPGDPLDALTDRQRETLLAAYDAGFFEWPRESTGQAVADDLSVAQPTFVEHLRRAEANLLAALLEE